MKVIRAETAGFCMGVELALKKLDLLLEERSGKGPIYILGPIIHNPQVLAEYAAKGVITAKSPEDIPAGASVVIRAHGVPKEIEERLRRRDVTIVDATCPKVKKAQVLIARCTAEGRKLLLYGEESHPEVKGLLSYAAADAQVFDDRAALFGMLAKDEKYCLASQTTQDLVTFEALAGELGELSEVDIVVLNTICDATKLRQDEATSVADEVDLMVVVGGFNSGNTRRLVQVVASRMIPCLHVETVEALPVEEISRFDCLGLTAGASTPKKMIDEVEAFLKRL
ncbi:4-hydroxy-3-methylbut-2-enyl diphosphate reductase [Desulfocurvibacter africanus PCS]|uniref:4-hydroxy-3-methylbut-2-enyl diphosphate reductase n=1 Tax=Desulfocurvibacter africanus PCS TaxID=1262666 RepID=M5Q357_DESAF|nr:4-hydroxy-3-methylbut-2-enyl diphosphate reductase [Desulfocurvibacter africanus]EMG39071.1 4-hydroxy-3-methylbut-2-enyl diphosphate reductase [Desulfocurvibacter africanus PCS]